MASHSSRAGRLNYTRVRLASFPSPQFPSTDDREVSLHLQVKLFVACFVAAYT